VAVRNQHFAIIEVPMIDRSKLPNTFEFVVTAGARARQLLAGSTPRVPVGEHKKTTIAAREVQTGAVEKVVPAVEAPAE
jgi:DNA-directed RNA polymerase omega subunit